MTQFFKLACSFATEKQIGQPKVCFCTIAHYKVNMEMIIFKNLSNVYRVLQMKKAFCLNPSKSTSWQKMSCKQFVS